MHEIAPGIEVFDTLLGGWTGVMAAHLVDGPAPALVDPGARTSAPVVREALAARGLGPDDLAWIVLTHVHLDHCGATGILAAAFPRATVVVHERGAPHLADPGRLVAGTAAVHGSRWSIYGGLDRTPAHRILAAGDGHRVPIGGGRVLTMIATPGHARHHMAVLDDATGTVMAGDAVGVRMPGAGLHPALPPPEVDPDAGDASLARIGALDPAVLSLAHFGPVPEPRAEVDRARRQLALVAAVARGAGPGGDVAAAVEDALPMAATVGHEGAVARWRALGWVENSAAGLEAWVAREGRDGRARQ